MTARCLALLAALALLSACHKREAVDGVLDAGADARARTAAKTLADLAAAEQASAAPLPRAPTPRTADAAAPPSPPQARQETDPAIEGNDNGE